MQITLILVGKTVDKWLCQGCEMYSERLKHYINFQQIIIPELKDTKKLSKEQIKEREGVQIMKHVAKGDTLVLFDERGKEYRSLQYADFLQQMMNSSVKNLIFVVGGAYGFSKEVYDRSDYKVSMSQMTFSHQMIRVLILEQLYRAFTILAHEPYHN